MLLVLSHLNVDFNMQWSVVKPVGPVPPMFCFLDQCVSTLVRKYVVDNRCTGLTWGDWFSYAMKSTSWLALLRDTSVVEDVSNLRA